MSERPKVYVYVRASTSKQETSPETQREAARTYAEFMKLGPIDAVFTDPAKSGKTRLRDREAGKALLRALRKGDHVIIAKLDRMSRNTRDFLDVLDEFRRKEVKLHICDLMGGALDLSSPIGTFVITILAATAELERNWISQRTKEGLATKKRNGAKHTRHAGYGKKWEKVGKDKVAVPDEQERTVMKNIAMWRMMANPYSWEEIEKCINDAGVLTKDGTPWSQSRIRRACKAEFALQLKEQRSMS